MGKGRPGYVEEMLSESYFRRAGIFNQDSISALLSKIEKTGAASEMDNMVLTAVISTHLVHHQFLEAHNLEYQNGELKNLKIIQDT